jgi:hypothetical protein
MKKLILILFAGLMIFSCNPLTVLNDVDRSVDFSQYKTVEFYGWTDGNVFGNNFTKQLIENAIQKEFKRRGIKTVEKGEGDIIISLYSVTEKRTETYTQTNASYAGGGRLYGGFGYGGYYGYGPGYGWGPSYVYTSATTGTKEYNDGTLIISAYDAKKEVLIWETVAMKTINKTSQTPEKDINILIKKIMTTYPVKP